MAPDLRIVIPMAGWGTRMRPHTWSKPKPLVSVAGQTCLDHLLDSFDSLPRSLQVEYVFIVSPFLGETQIPAYMQAHYPQLKVHYVVQSVMRGQSDALYLARRHLQGPLLMVYSDTLVEADFSSLPDTAVDGIAWVKAVDDPRRFGVAEVGAEGAIRRLIEKPESLENKLVLVGCYYFHSGQDLLAAIQEQFRRDVKLKGEYFLADAINILLESHPRFSTRTVGNWLDTGTVPATLETNRYLLAHGRENAAAGFEEDVEIVRPVFVHPTAQVTNSSLGPHVSIGAGCVIRDSQIKDSILEEEVSLEAVNLEGSLLGSRVAVKGKGREAETARLNLGDDCSVEM